MSIGEATVIILIGSVIVTVPIVLNGVSMNN